MNRTRVIAVTVFGCIILFGIMSCNVDPWTTGGNVVDTDMVTITKTTRFGTGPDGGFLRSNVGGVKMSHSKHQDAGMECIDCHHKAGNPERIKRCANKGCHTGEDGYETMHGFCLGCHIKEGNGIEKCKQCH